MLLGVLAACFLLLGKYWLAPRIPPVVLFPVGLIVVILVQYAVGKISYFEQATLFILYMLWIFLLMVVGKQLRQIFGMQRLALVLSVFLLAGSELSALSGVIQHYRWHTLLDPVITAKTGIAVYGNLAQPNHFADYLMLGLISLAYLRRHMQTWQVVAFAAPLLFVMVLSGSRSSWLYMAALALFAWSQERKAGGSAGLFRYMLLLVVAFFMMHWVVQLQVFHGTAGSVTTMQRMMSGETSGSIRLYLWKEALLIFARFPLLGAGWEQFAWQHFLLGPELKNMQISGLYNNAHNLLLQFAAETGLAGVLVIVLAFLGWFRSIWTARLDTEIWWGMGILLVIGIHSMLEYPLWYAYFTGIAALLLGALDTRAYTLKLKVAGRYALVFLLLFGAGMLWQSIYGYRQLESLILQHAHSGITADKERQFRAHLREMIDMPLLRPMTELYLNSYIEINPQDLVGKLAWNERVAMSYPVNTAIYNRSLLLAQAGRFSEAEQIMNCSIWAFPKDFPYYQNELSLLAQKDPAHFAGLLKFAIQSKQEYERATVSD